MIDRAAALFLDTAYVLARLNERDDWHTAALTWERRIAVSRIPLITTEFVLTEIGGALAKVRYRNQAVSVIDLLQANTSIQIISASSDLFHAGLRLYRTRPDKDWGLTDCTSFTVMQSHDCRRR